MGNKLPERSAWEKLRQGLLEQLGFVWWRRIESPLTAPGFPDLIAIHAYRGVEFIELKAWDAKVFRTEDIPWNSPAQLLTLRQIARRRGRAFVYCCLNSRTWHVVQVGFSGELTDVTPSPAYAALRT